MEQKSFLKTRVTEAQSIVDIDTGEIIEEKIKCHKYLANTKEEFFIAYSSMLLALEEHSTDAKVKLFAYLVRIYAQGNPFSMAKELKEIIAKEINLSPRTLDNTLTQLIDMRFIIRIKRNVYQINPRHIFKGSTLERNKRLATILHLYCPDC